MGLPPQLELLAVFRHKSGHDNMSDRTNAQFHSGMGTQTQTDCAYIFPSLNPSSFGVVSNNLASQYDKYSTTVFLEKHCDITTYGT